MQLQSSKTRSGEDENKWGYEIPQDLLDLIAQHITAPQDFCRFGAVCTSWRKSAVRQNYFVDTAPWFMIMPLTTDLRYCFFDPSTCRTLKLHHLQHAMSDGSGTKRLTITEAGQGWLLLHDPHPRMRRAQLLNPLTNTQFNLPPIPYDYFYKIVISSDPNKVNELIVLLHHFGQVQYITRVGEGVYDGQGWVKVDGGPTKNMYLERSFVSHKGRFYFIDFTRSMIVCIDGTSELPSVMDVAALPLKYESQIHPDPGTFCKSDFYLVSGADGPLLCIRCIHFAGRELPDLWNWQMYRLEMKKNEKVKLVMIETLRNGAIFITDKFSHYVSKLAASSHGYQRNCIYFQSNSISWVVEGPMIWECNLEDGVRKPLYSYPKMDRDLFFPNGYNFPNLWLVPSLW